MRTPLINKPDRRRRIARDRDRTVMRIILWTHALALVLVVISYAQIDSVDAANQLQPDYAPMRVPAPVDDGGEFEPDLFCAWFGISGDHTMAEVWSAEMDNAVGPGSVMPASLTNANPETVWPANVTVGTVRTRTRRAQAGTKAQTCQLRRWSCRSLIPVRPRIATRWR